MLVSVDFTDQVETQQLHVNLLIAGPVNFYPPFAKKLIDLTIKF
jgi:hypothetical protein